MRNFLVALVIVINFLITSLSTFQCGVRKLNINRVIVRGQPTYPGEWPWHVAVYHRSGVSDSYACGGSLISEFFVLTADHCVKGDNGFVLSTRRIFVRVGVHNFQDPDPQTFQQHRIQQIHHYEESTNLKNDIALLELSTKVLFTNYVQPVCVNQVEDLTKQYGTAIGWGVTEHDEESPVLKSSQMPVVSTVQCLESNDGVFRPVLDSSNFCAGYLNGTTVCNGDSGGGLHFERNGIWYIGGIISFTAPRQSSLICHTSSYAGFTNVYRFSSWIRTVTSLQYLFKNLSQDGDFVAMAPSKGFESYTELPNQNSSQNIATKMPIHLPEDCGRYLVNRITSGSVIQPYEFPWIAEIIERDDFGWVSKGKFGSLIHKRYVLTDAAYYGSDFVRLGEYNRRTKKCPSWYEVGCDLPIQDIDIESTTRHPEFDDHSLQNNIALIRLAKNAIFTDNVQPICLSKTTMAIPNYIAVGWGNEESSEILQKAIVPAVDLSECLVKAVEYRKRAFVGKGIICAGTAVTSNACYGDHGAPLGFPYRFPDKGVRFVQYGITSIIGCDEGPSLYTDVAFYMANMRP